MKIYLVAGEPSGDLLGARFMRAMRRKEKNVEFFGVGGDAMEAEGLKPLFDISDLAVMGLTEVIPSIPKVLRHIKETVADIYIPRHLPQRTEAERRCRTHRPIHI